MVKIFETLDFPNYLSNLLTGVSAADNHDPISDYLLNTFAEIWAQTLATEQPEPVSVIEPACGSANDYRFIDAFGIAPFLQYTGFDLSKKNILNAKTMYPTIHFRTANVFEIPADDKRYDYCFVHDLFEHLSIEGIERALSEICRVTSKKICLHFFNMADSDEHQIQKTGDYYWNCLSASRVREYLADRAGTITIIQIDRFLKEQFGYSGTQNKQQWTWLIDLV